MTRSILAAALLLAAANPGSAQAMPHAVSPALPRLPLTLSSVFCGATGCMPVTRVKRCAPDTVNNGLPAQRAIIVRHTCNFL